MAIGLIFLCCSYSKAHRYYFSLTEIKITTAKPTIELSCKLFTDDVEDALLKLTHRKMDLMASQENKTVQQQVNNYFQERIRMEVNNVPCKIGLIGFETENDVTWFYLEADAVAVKTAHAKIKITNTLLYDFLEDQTNVMSVRWNEKERTEKLVNPEKEIVFEF